MRREIIRARASNLFWKEYVVSKQVFDGFLMRIEEGELDDVQDIDQRTREFGRELISAADAGALSRKEVAMLWLHDLKRRGYVVEIPEP